MHHQTKSFDLCKITSVFVCFFCLLIYINYYQKFTKIKIEPVQIQKDDDIKQIPPVSDSEIARMASKYSFYHNTIDQNSSYSVNKVVKNEFLTTYHVKLTPYRYTSPRGLTKEMDTLFWKQEENHRNFYDASVFKTIDTYGFVEEYHNALFQGPYRTQLRTLII